MKNQLKILEKEFDNSKIRTVWDKEQEKYYISVVDIVSVLTESKGGRKYWNKLKQRLKDEGNETVTNCHQLKFPAEDGKMRLTDVVDIEGMFRLIESIPSKKAEPIKLWLARLGKERIDEEYNSVMKEECVDIKDRKYPLDYWICVLAFTFDLYFKETLLIVKENNYIDILIDRFNYNNSKEKMNKIRNVLNDYIEKRLNN